MTAVPININQIYNNLRNSQHDLRKEFSYVHFSKFNTTMLEDWINRLNTEFGWNIEIPSKNIDGRFRLRNMKYDITRIFNNHRVYEILEAFGVTIDDIPFDLIDKIVDCIKQLKQEEQRQRKQIREQQQRQRQKRHEAVVKYKQQIDNDFFNNFNRDDYKNSEPYDELTRMNVQTKFDKALAIERSINIAKQALTNALQLIQDNQHEILRKQNESTENQELYDYLKNNHHKRSLSQQSCHTFKSKDNAVLMINEPHDSEKAIETYQLRNNIQDEAEHTDEQSKPIYVYYYNNII